MLVVETILSGCSLEDANQKISTKNTSISFPELLTKLFQSHFIEKNNENEDSEYIDDQNIDKLRGEIENKFEDNQVLVDLGNISKILWSEFDVSSFEWLEEKYVSTFALSVMTAGEFLRDIDTDDLILDIVPNNSETNYENINTIEKVLLYLKFLLGAGIIENFLKAYSQDQEVFLHLFTVCFSQTKQS